MPLKAGSAQPWADPAENQVAWVQVRHDEPPVGACLHHHVMPPPLYFTVAFGSKSAALAQGPRTTCKQATPSSLAVTLFGGSWACPERSKLWPEKGPQTLQSGSLSSGGGAMEGDRAEAGQVIGFGVKDPIPDCPSPLCPRGLHRPGPAPPL